MMRMTGGDDDNKEKDKVFSLKFVEEFSVTTLSYLCLTYVYRWLSWLPDSKLQEYKVFS